MARQIAEKRRGRERNATLAKRAQAGSPSRTSPRPSSRARCRPLNLILKGDVSGSVEALEDALLKIDVGDEVDLRVIHRGVGAITQNDVNLAVASRRGHHRLQRPAGRAGSASWPSARASTSATTRSSTRRSRRSRRRSRACSSRSTRRSSSAPPRSARSSARSKFGNIAGAWSAPARSAATPRRGCVRDGVVVADNLTDRVAAAVQGRRDRGPRGLRVRYRPRVVQRHQGRRRHRDVRDAREAARLSLGGAGARRRAGSAPGSLGRRGPSAPGVHGDVGRGDMFVGTLSLDLLLGDVHSLKEKRSLVRPIVAELRRKYDGGRGRGRPPGPAPPGRGRGGVVVAPDRGALRRGARRVRAAGRRPPRDRAAVGPAAGSDERRGLRPTTPDASQRTIGTTDDGRHRTRPQAGRPHPA